MSLVQVHVQLNLARYIPMLPLTVGHALHSAAPGHPQDIPTDLEKNWMLQVKLI